MQTQLITTTSQNFVQAAPVSADIRGTATALGRLAGVIDEADWLLVRTVMRNLMAAAEQVEMMERHFSVPRREA